MTNFTLTRRAALAGLGAALATPAIRPAFAQGAPKVLHLVVPFGPGGGQDVLARSFNNELGAALVADATVSVPFGRRAEIFLSVENAGDTRIETGREPALPHRFLPLLTHE